MKNFLILRLSGPMQAWGKHTFESTRFSFAFPTRSALLGLLGGCLGLDRQDFSAHVELGESLLFSVRQDERCYEMNRLVDFHTVMGARCVAKSDPHKNNKTILTGREYLCDAQFTVAIHQKQKNETFDLDQLANALQKPCYTPVLGRRSCPIVYPLFKGFFRAENPVIALSSIEPYRGVIYREEFGDPALGRKKIELRDVPLKNEGSTRLFMTRTVWIS